jgi:DNA topoisomerase IA
MLSKKDFLDNLYEDKEIIEIYIESRLNSNCCNDVEVSAQKVFEVAKKLYEWINFLIIYLKY